MGPYQIGQVVLAGGFAFAAIYCAVQWSQSRRQHLFLVFTCACLIACAQALTLALLAGAETTASTRVLFQLRGIGGALQVASVAWLISGLSGAVPRRYLWSLTAVLGLTSLAMMAGAPVLGSVVGVERVPMPWGEVVSVPVRQLPGFVGVPPYIAVLSVPVFGFQAAWGARRSDRTAAILLAITAVLLVVGLGVSIVVDLAAVRLPYLGAAAHAIAVLILGVQMGERSRRQAARLVATEGRFRAIFDHTFEFIGLVAADGTLLEANRTALEFAGVRQEDVIGKPFWEGPWWLHSPELQARLRAAVDAARGGDVVRFEATHPGADGRMHTVDFSLKPVREANGSIELLIPEGRDITGRRQVEDALRQSEERYRFLLRNQTGFVVTCGPDGTLTFANDSFVRFLGSPPEALVGRSLLAHVADEYRDRMAQALAEAPERAPVPFEMEMVDGDGERRWAEWIVTVLRDDEGRLVGRQVTGADVHEKVLAEQARRQLEQHLARSRKLEALGHLAGGVAHDFNNLLTVIEGHTQLLELDLQEADARGEIAEIQAASRRAAHMTRELLAFSRRSELRVAVVDVAAVVQRTEAVLARTIGADIALTVRCDPGHHEVEADADQLGRVLLNLAMNARDAMPHGGRLTIEIRTAVLDDAVATSRGLAPGPFVEIVVRDTGTGIPPDVRPRVFEPFFTTKSADGRTGMGLAVAVGIIAQCGGAIDVESEAGRGSAFTIHLPRAGHAAAES